MYIPYTIIKCQTSFYHVWVKYVWKWYKVNIDKCHELACTETQNILIYSVVVINHFMKVRFLLEMLNISLCISSAQVIAFLHISNGNSYRTPINPCNFYVGIFQQYNYKISFVNLSNRISYNARNIYLVPLPMLAYTLYISHRMLFTEELRRVSVWKVSSPRFFHSSAT